MEKKSFSRFLLEGNLVKRIAIGLVLGIILGIASPYIQSLFGINLANKAGFLGQIFVRSLRSIAPILVLFLVMAAITNKKIGTPSNMKSVLFLYVLGTFLAAVTAVFASFLFPTEIALTHPENSLTPPTAVMEVLKSLTFSVVDNPFNALFNANFIGILAWAIGLGLALRMASESTKIMVNDLSDAISKIVAVVVAFAPLGVFGLVAETIDDKGLHALLGYVHLLVVLIGSMLFVAFVVNPLIVFYKTKKNPYPLVWKCVRISGVTAFFTRSSAANIPINMKLSKDMNLNEETYSISIPLGATINMAGAAITITVLTLAAVHTLNIPISITTAILLSVVASVCACGASGVPGGSLLLIPLACSLFGVTNDVAAQVIGVGFIIGVLQDSAETALNSSTDVVFTAAVCISEEEKITKLSS